MSEEKIKKTKFATYLWEHGLSLKEVERITGVSYPTLVNLKMGRPINYRQRTLRDIASFCKCTIAELLGQEDEIKYNTVFEKAMADLSAKKNVPITLQVIHEATGVSLPILTNLKKGGPIKCRKRTIRDVAEFLQISEDELWNNNITEIKDEEASSENPSSTETNPE